MKLRQATKIMRNVARARQTTYPAGSRPWRRPIYRGDTITKAERRLEGRIERYMWYGISPLSDVSRAFAIVSKQAKLAAEAMRRAWSIPPSMFCGPSTNYGS